MGYKPCLVPLKRLFPKLHVPFTASSLPPGLRTGQGGFWPCFLGYLLEVVIGNPQASSTNKTLQLEKGTAKGPTVMRCIYTTLAVNRV